jgi:hypothetical protein
MGVGTRWLNAAILSLIFLGIPAVILVAISKNEFE